MTAYGERREAARKLREIADEDEWIVVKLAAALGIDLMRCESREEGEAEVVRRIADLVDPTCRNVDKTGEGFACSECGCEVKRMASFPDAFENPCWEPTIKMPNGRGVDLQYCPHCGARVVGR